MATRSASNARSRTAAGGRIPSGSRGATRALASLYSVLGVIAFTALAPMASALQAEEDPFVIGIVLDGPWLGNQDTEALFKNEILDLTRGEFDVRFPAEYNAVGDWSSQSVAQAIDRLLADPNVDLILTAGVLGSAYVTQIEELPKPAIATFIVDTKLQGVPSAGNSSGRNNLCYFTSPSDIERDLRAFTEVVPFERFTILLNRHIFESIPGIGQRFDQVAASLGLTYEAILVSDEIDSVLAQLEPEDQAVYVAPLLQVSAPDFDRLVAGLIERQLPSYSLYGRAEVEKGLLCTRNPRLDFVRYARRTAITVQRILLGENAGDLPVEINLKGGLVINMATARAIGTWPSWSILMDAELLNEEPLSVDRSWSLPAVMREASTINLDLAAADAGLAAGAEQVREARAPLRPQIDASISGVLIDDDRAASFIAPAERTVTGSLALRQLVYSDAAFGNLEIQERLQDSREHDRNSLQLDVVLEVALAYLDVLATKSLERIQKNNLRLTRSNLELAETRLDVGVANASEVYRWESELATSKRDVLDSTARRRQAEVALNRVLRRPQSETFDTAESGITEPEIGLDARLVEILDNPWGFGVFSDLMVEQGLEKAPELRAVRAAIEARSRANLAAKRTYYAPEVGLEASADYLIEESGTGTGLRPTNDTDWSVALFASLPLYQGGGRSATRGRTRHELIQLRLEWEALEDRVEERIRTALLAISASRPALQLSEQGAEAARRNLELVQDAYAQGTVTIIQLLDAQNAALVADQVAANAVYSFQADVMRAQRAVGGFSVFLTAQERDAWILNVEAHFEASRALPARNTNQ